MEEFRQPNSANKKTWRRMMTHEIAQPETGGQR